VMVLEATAIVIDNSEWSRNSDFTRTRLQAQCDSAGTIFTARRQDNAENQVSLISMAGQSPQVYVTLTADEGQLYSAIHEVKPRGTARLSTAIQIAQLCLKHRQNKNLKQRIIAFICSPMEEDERTLVRIAKKLKKNNVAVDFVSFGEDAHNDEKLEKFIAAVNSGDNSHLVTVPPGPYMLSDYLLSTPIIGGDNPTGGMEIGRSEGFDFSVDPNLDPELALALRLSLEEEEQRQEWANASSSQQPEASSVDALPSSSAVPQATVEDDEELSRALAMSMGGDDDVAMDDSAAAPQAESKAVADDLASVINNLPGMDQKDQQDEDMDKKDGQ